MYAIDHQHEMYVSSYYLTWQTHINPLLLLLRPPSHSHTLKQSNKLARRSVHVLHPAALVLPGHISLQGWQVIVLSAVVVN